jgi:cysteine desulfurase
MQSSGTLTDFLTKNNEVGTIQPIADVVRLVKSKFPDVVIHTDASQSVGKISVNVSDLGVDLLTIAGHKLYAPKGVGALFMKRNTHIEKFHHGASHEAGRRAGTENVLLNVALGQACSIALADGSRVAEHTKAMSERLHGKLQELLPGQVLCVLSSRPAKTVPYSLV